MDFKPSRLTFDAGVAMWNFTFSFDISDNWWRERDRGNLHNFEAHIKLRSIVFLKVQWGETRHSQTRPKSTFQSLYRALCFHGRSESCGLAWLHLHGCEIGCHSTSERKKWNSISYPLRDWKNALLSFAQGGKQHFYRPKIDMLHKFKRTEVQEDSREITHGTEEYLE